MVQSLSHRQCCAVAAEVDDRQVVAHLVSPVTAILRVAVPELAVAVVAPALHRTTVEDHTHQIVAGKDRQCRAAGAEIDDRQVVAHLLETGTTIIRVAVPELA